jgi:hypothetical protein
MDIKYIMNALLKGKHDAYCTVQFCLILRVK